MTDDRRSVRTLALSLRRGQGIFRWSILPILALWGCAAAASEAHAQSQDEERCIPVEQFLVGDLGMRAEIDPDTIDDWRTQRHLPGCRVTAAGVTQLSMEAEAARFYERLQAAGWSRTPDPRDAPAESSLRFRTGETDCLFNFYEGLLLFTEAELEVSTAMAPRPGEARYNVFVMCKPAMDAAPRGTP